MIELLLLELQNFTTTRERTSHVVFLLRMFAALASGTVDQSVLKPKNPLLDLKAKTPPPPDPDEETRSDMNRMNCMKLR